MMKKKLFSLLLSAFVFCHLSAQTFTATNRDGVNINYQVISASDHTVGVDTGHYTGRVVIPDSVTFNGDTYAVINTFRYAFENSTVTYVCFPATLTKVGMWSFLGCTTLDTLEFLSSIPPVAGEALSNSYRAEYLFNRSNYNTRPDISVIVPCGHLSDYRKSPWGCFRKLKSPCSHQIIVLPADSTMHNYLKFDDIIDERYKIIEGSSGVGVGGGGITYRNVYSRIYNNSFYEIGDTVTLVCTILNNYDSIQPMFFGWNKPFIAIDKSIKYSIGYHGYIVQGPDTVIGYFGLPAFGHLAANNISTPVSVIANMYMWRTNEKYMIL
ncbi:MAG: hypothetical protein J5605_05070, partial [Bacteroidales bacterium]|nr:hypothetical protein [Bacteroidales bacterium]